MSSGQGDEDRSIARSIRRFLVAAAVVASLVLLVLWRIDNPRLERARMALTDAVVPEVTWITAPLAVAGGIASDYRRFLDVYDQNRRLRREIQALRSWRERARQLEEENAQLRALNNVRLAPRMTFVTGDVIADSGGPYREAALVNVGRSDGVGDGAAAVDGNGLVGRVVGVGENAARILLLTDFSSRVPVMIQPSGRRAILAGDGTGTPRLEFIDQPEQVRPGNPIETSGDGGVFPPRLPIGQVIETARGQFRASLLSQPRELEFVRILNYAPDTRIDRPGGLIRPGRTGPGSGDATDLLLPARP